MLKHAHARRPGHPMIHRIAFRISEADHHRLMERARKARARTASEYVRAVALDGQQIEVFDYELQRKVLNAVIALAQTITDSPPGEVRDRALERVIHFVDHIVS
jgi:hypothetical protein